MANVTTIRRNKRNTFGDTLGVLGQGLSGYMGGYMGKQQMDMAKQNAAAQQDMAKAMMQKAFGTNGEGIQPMNELPQVSAMPDMRGQQQPMSYQDLLAQRLPFSWRS